MLEIPSRVEKDPRHSVKGVNFLSCAFGLGGAGLYGARSLAMQVIYSLALWSHNQIRHNVLNFLPHAYIYVLTHLGEAI